MWQSNNSLQKLMDRFFDRKLYVHAPLVRGRHFTRTQNPQRTSTGALAAVDHSPTSMETRTVSQHILRLKARGDDLTNILAEIGPFIEASYRLRFFLDFIILRKSHS